MFITFFGVNGSGRFIILRGDESVHGHVTVELKLLNKQEEHTCIHMDVFVINLVNANL